MGDIEAKLHELDEWYAGSDDLLVNDVVTPDDLVGTYRSALERCYGRVPDDMLVAFSKHLGTYSAMHPAQQRRCYGIVCFSLVQFDAAADEEHEQCVKSILDIAELAPMAFTVAGEDKERWLFQRIRHYLACDQSDPPEPDSPSNLRAVISLLCGERNL